MSTETPGPAPKTDSNALALTPPQLGGPLTPALSLTEGERESGRQSPGPGFIRRFGWRIAALALLLVCSILAWRWMAHRGSAIGAPSTGVAADSPESPVAVAKVTREDLYNEVTTPAEFRPYLEVELHAKVSGYLEQIDVDMGDRVKAGQLLARLEVPELKNEMDRARAAAKRAEADYKDAHTAYTRLLAVEKARPNLVAQQELDAAETRDSTTEAAVAAAKADIEKYQTMLSYTRITAPFDGVVTRRCADPGALIQAGTASDTQTRPLVRLSDNYRLRLDFPVSVAYVKNVRAGDTVEVRVESCNKAFTGTISRSAQKVDEDTRTMLTEVEVPNPTLDLVPGMYATVVLKVERRPQVLTIPTEAVSGARKGTVYVVNTSQEIEERPVKLGLETSDRLEVLTGLKEGELVMIGSRSQVKPGQKVAAKLVEAGSTPEKRRTADGNETL